MNERTVLVLGARGRIGLAAVDAFARGGWRVLAHARTPLTNLPRGAESVHAPLDDVEAIVTAARGARAVLYAVNPPYTAWAKEMMPLARQGFAIAERLGALFLLPGNVYAYGEKMPEVLTPDTPEHPTTEKGRLRSELEHAMMARPGLRSAVVRAGDFFGAGTGSWFDLALVKSLPRGKLVYPGPLDVPHAWAYLPDLARAFVAVAEADDGATKSRRLHFAGYTLTGQQLLDAIERAAKEVGLARARRFRRGGVSWGLMRVGGAFVPMWRELAAMSYLWRTPHRLDGAALESITGPLPATPVDEAIRSTLLDLGFAQRAPRIAAGT